MFFFQFPRMEGKPEKPPHSAYSLFSRTMLKDEHLRKKFLTPKERMQEIARLWKEVPKADKEMYVEEVKRVNFYLQFFFIFNCQYWLQVTTSCLVYKNVNINRLNLVPSIDKIES